jgi:hypothetical protein
MQTMNDQEKFSMPTACRRHVYVNYVGFSFVLKNNMVREISFGQTGVATAVVILGTVLHI